MAAATVASRRHRRDSQVSQLYARLPTADDGVALPKKAVSMLLNGVFFFLV